jgi:hypothetical protein
MLSHHQNRNTWKWEGRSPQNPKIKNAIKVKCPCNPKTLNLIYFTNRTLLGKTKHTTSIKTLENGGYITSKLSNFIMINLKHRHLSGPPKISYPLYVTNVAWLGKKNTPWWSQPSKMGGRSPQNSPKKTQTWWGHTLNPKP